MDFDLDIYQGESREYFGEYAIAPVLRKAALLHFGELAQRGQIELQLEESHDDGPYPGPPQVHNLTKKFARCHLRLIQDGQTVCQDRLRIVDLFGPVLANELHRMRPDEARWSFQLRRRLSAIIILSDNRAGDMRPAPHAQGSVDVDPNRQRHQPFTLTPVTSVEAEPVQPEQLGLDAKRLEKINILMSADIHEDLLRRMPLSGRMEEGGFLLGRVARAGEAHLVEITHVTPAHRSGAGAVHFTFTGDSFLAVARLLEERGFDEQLVGWYHTHLFGADQEKAMLGVDDIGLSSIDVDLHLATFQRSWQVAALINIERNGRLLRIYGRDDKKLREYEQWIADDSGKYRPARRALGSE